MLVPQLTGAGYCTDAHRPAGGARHPHRPDSVQPGRGAIAALVGGLHDRALLKRRWGVSALSNTPSRESPWQAISEADSVAIADGATRAVLGSSSTQRISGASCGAATRLPSRPPRPRATLLAIRLGPVMAAQAWSTHPATGLQLGRSPPPPLPRMWNRMFRADHSPSGSRAGSSVGSGLQPHIEAAGPPLPSRPKKSAADHGRHQAALPAAATAGSCAVIMLTVR